MSSDVAVRIPTLTTVEYRRRGRVRVFDVIICWDKKRNVNFWIRSIRVKQFLILVLVGLIDRGLQLLLL